MKRILSSLALSLYAIFSVHAAGFLPHTNLLDTSANKTITKTIVLDNTYKKMDYFQFECGHDNWMNRPTGINIKPVSRGISTYITYPMHLAKSPFDFIVGAGITVDNIYTNGTPKTDSLGATYFSPITKSYKFNKIANTYVEVPLLFSYKTKADRNNRSFKFNAGIRMGLHVTTRQKYKGNDANNNYIAVKYLSVPNMNRLRANAQVSVGYDWVYLVATYSLTPYFTSGKGTNIHPFFVGVGIVGF
jgi:hypothetical protein